MRISPACKCARPVNGLVNDGPNSSSSNGWSALLPGRTLNPGEELRSHSGVYKIRMQGDGNLVAYNGNDEPYWSSYTQGRPGSVLTMQTDGNLVLHNLDGALGWHSGSFGHPGAFFVVDDDGNMVVTDTNGAPLWSVWQNTYDRGSGLNQWVGRFEGSLGGVVSVARSLAKVLRVALPAVGAVISVTGVGAPLGLALAGAGAEIAAVDEAVGEVQALSDVAQQAVDGYNAAVAVLNDLVSPDQIAAARASLQTDADRAAFDFALANASQLASNSTAVDSANAVLGRKPTFSATHGAIGTVLASPGLVDYRHATLGGVNPTLFAPSPTPKPKPPPAPAMTRARAPAPVHAGKTAAVVGGGAALALAAGLWAVFA